VTATAWTEYAFDPVYSPGKAYYPTVLKEGSTYTMWSDSATGVQMATSTNGIDWTPAGSVTGLTAPKHTLVEKIGGSYQMWYWPNLGYSINDIRTATSTDGLTWTGDQAVTQVGKTVIYGGNDGSIWNRGSYGPADVLYNPAGSSTIVAPVDKASVWANKFVMYYDGTNGGAESLGLAVSNDGINWQGYNGGVAPVLAGSGVGGSWDRTYVSRATVIREGDSLFHMWYSGGDGNMQSGIGYASSADGITWVRAGDNPIFHKTDGVGWRDERTYTPMVIGDEMWFTGRDAQAPGMYAIGYATGEAPTTPVPEPVTMAGLMLGIGSLVGYARKRRMA
jgi:hypothetical protein